MKNDTEQALFWKKNFGDKYTSRAYRNSQVYTTRLKSWIEILKLSNDIKSVFEIGTNLGINLDAIKSLSNNQIKTHGIEINKKAYQICKKKNHSVINKDILNFRSKKKYDLSFSWGVLIHIHPNNLEKAYDLLYRSSKKYILVSEYFSHDPVNISYRGYNNKLFKRDFAKEIKNKYNLKIIDYKFLWSEDPLFPCDNTTWFLMSKN